MTHACKKTARVVAAAVAGIALGLGPTGAIAAEWSDTSIGWRYGTRFAEPFEGNDIHKHILDFQHASGYRYGTNFFNVDLLMSDSKDPANGGGPNGNSTAGAQEAYVVYRNFLSLGKITAIEYKYGPVRDIGATLGFDWNTKNDAYGSRKRMLVGGPTLSIDVPGFLNVSVYALSESNAPNGIDGRYYYKTHPMLDINWNIPFGDSPFNFQGYFDYIGAKGTNEFGSGTVPETHADVAIMLDVGRVAGAPKNTFKLGVEYEYWRNKFGNDHTGPAGDGAFAKTPMIRAEYHF